MSSPRKSVLEAVPGLHISSSSAQATRGSANRALSSTLSRAFSNGWPTGCGGSSNSASHTINSTVKLAEHLQAEVRKLRLPVEPAEIIVEARKTSRRAGVKAIPELWGQLEDSLTNLIYGSNKIETAGSSLPITVQLCQMVFKSIHASIDISERDPSYRDHLQVLHSTNRTTDAANVIRSRKEVAFHAKALIYMIEHLVLNDEPWSEDIICHAHAILSHGLDDDVEAGSYRDHDFTVAYGDKGKRRICLRASAVPKYMSNMIQELNNEIEEHDMRPGRSTRIRWRLVTITILS